VLADLVTADLQHVYLGHLSRDCNSPELARRTIQDRLNQVGATHTGVNSTSQEQRCETLTLTSTVPIQAALPF
jgi:hypothetical protein